MTELQSKMLRKIARNDFTTRNGSEPDSVEEIGWVWADFIIEDAEDKGVFTSLMNAGLVDHDGKDRDAMVTLTAIGFVAYKDLAAPAVPAPLAPVLPPAEIDEATLTDGSIVYNVRTVTRHGEVIIIAAVDAAHARELVRQLNRSVDIAVIE